MNDQATQYKIPSTAILDKRLQALDRPGEHLWVMLASWHLADPESAAISSRVTLLDQESIVAFAGPGCFKCEKPYSRSMAKRRCLGSVKW